MKKLAILLVFILSSTNISFAETFFEPQWNEFCPNQYINIDENEDYFMPEKKYWAKRKRDFNSHLQTCRNTYDKDACFSNLRELEKNATKTHLDELNVKYVKYNYWWN